MRSMTEGLFCLYIRVSLNKPTKSTVKTRRYKLCAKPAEVRGELTQQGYPQKCPQEIFGEEAKPQSGLGGQASLICPPASARFDEVSDPRNP